MFIPVLQPRNVLLPYDPMYISLIILIGLKSAKDKKPIIKPAVQEAAFNLLGEESLLGTR